MDESELKNEVLELSLACQRGDATAEERARLERLLADEPQAVLWYLRVIDDTLTLHSAATRNAATSDAAAISAPADTTPFESVLSHASKVADDTRSRRRVLAWAAVASMLLLSAMAPWWWAPKTSVASATTDANLASARVVSLANVRWADGAKQFKEWSFIAPGDDIKFDAGLVDLYLSNGAEVLIEGPADVTFVSLEKMFARQGKMAARVGPGAVGFRIETAHANIIDRGTAFGISVDPHCRTSVVVYEGLVDFDVIGDGKPPRRQLTTGEGLSVNKNGEVSRITTVQGSDFLEPPQARAAMVEPGAIIASVSDNVRSLETAKYYRIMPHGFREDCRSYVDRDHQWNGVDDRGLPPFLIGGDYVMTFNGDKIAPEIEMAVTLNQPASLYVIVDDRVAPPEWLKRDFVDTQWDVGSDEGYPDRIIDNGFGAGQSIDHVCSVWRRDVLEPTTVILGALSHEKSDKPAEDVERSMYGVVATPLRRDQ